MESSAINGISIQVSLSGYSFILEGTEGERRSGWLGADRVFTTPEFQKRYDHVSISLFTPKFSLVPRPFFNPEEARMALSSTARLGEGDAVEWVEIPEYGAVLVYSNAIGESLSRAIRSSVLDTAGNQARILPEIYYMISSLKEVGDYNKIVASYMDGRLYLAVAQGKSLLLANSFEAVDFTTAEYFIFMVLKKLQLNPEISTVAFRSPLTGEQEMSLYRYFKSVEKI